MNYWLVDTSYILHSAHVCCWHTCLCVFGNIRSTQREAKRKRVNNPQENPFLCPQQGFGVPLSILKLSILETPIVNKSWYLGCFHLSRFSFLIAVLKYFLPIFLTPFISSLAAFFFVFHFQVFLLLAPIHNTMIQVWESFQNWGNTQNTNQA